MIESAEYARWATWNEIAAQPQIWAAFSAELAQIAGGLRAWIDGRGVDEVWFCGAGTSAYIGDIAVATLPSHGRLRFRSVPTTDLVASPRRYFDGSRRPLVVSFGRSGQSTETIGVLDLMDRLAPDAPRLNITCNRQSTLATRIPAGGAAQRVIVLPAATHDAGFAMTSSFTTMLMTALMLFAPDAPEALAAQVHIAAAAAPQVLAAATGWAEASPRPERVVFAGAGAGQHVAREAALKVMELTAGAVPALSESVLGFRHGPKSFMTPGACVIIFTPQTAPASLYAHDLAVELAGQYGADAVTCVGGSAGDLPLPDVGVMQPMLQILMAQVAAVIWSHQLGLNVDDPFAGAGTLSRVVSHVRLHTDQG